MKKYDHNDLFDDDALLGRPKQKTESTESDDQDQRGDAGDHSSEGEGVGELTPGEIEKAFFDKENAKDNHGNLTPQRQFKPDIQSVELQKYIQLLMSGKGNALEHFLQLLKENKISAGMLKKVVATIAKSISPHAAKTLNSIFDATPSQALRQEMTASVKKIRPSFSGDKKEEYQPPSPFKDPTKIPELKRD